MHFELEGKLLSIVLPLPRPASNHRRPPTGRFLAYTRILLRTSLGACRFRLARASGSMTKDFAAPNLAQHKTPAANNLHLLKRLLLLAASSRPRAVTNVLLKRAAIVSVVYILVFCTYKQVSDRLHSSLSV